MAANFDPKVLRKHILHMASVGDSVHIGCAFSLVEIVSVLYGKILKYNPENPKDPSRDYMVLSKGHGVMALYACLREIGWLAGEHFDNYFSDGSLLHGLGEARIPGIEVTAGSLGHGLPIAVGLAYGIKRLKENRNVYCIIGDGEMNEGTIWESLLFAGHHRLGNLAVIVDANGFQAMGDVNEIMSIEPISRKFRSFGFRALECDGHNSPAIERCLQEVGKNNSPLAIITRTVKGKGVSFMENNNQWHYLRLNKELLEKSLQEVANA